MDIKKLIIGLVLIPLLSFCNIEADTEIIIITPLLNLGGIETFFGVNHQNYALQPEVLEWNAISFPIFSEKEAFAIQDNGYAITKNLQRETFIALPVTLSTPKMQEELTVSLSEEGQKSFALLPKYKNLPKIEVKLFVVDFESEERPFPVKEISADRAYDFEEAEGKPLFLFIPKTEGEKG